MQKMKKRKLSPQKLVEIWGKKYKEACITIPSLSTVRRYMNSASERQGPFGKQIEKLIQETTEEDIEKYGSEESISK